MEEYGMRYGGGRRYEVKRRYVVRRRRWWYAIVRGLST